MVDTLTPERRSEIMSHIRAKGSKPEMVVRKLVHGLGYRYRLHAKNLPGKPDLVFRPRRKAIFVHGCFWHWHDDASCKISRVPKSNTDYWLPKLQRNRSRDFEHQVALREANWGDLIIWECELTDLEAVADRVVAFLG